MDQPGQESSLPEPQELFERFVLPHYSEEDRLRLVKPHVRGDIYKMYKPNLEVPNLSPLTLEHQAAFREQLDTMVKAAESDSSTYLEVRRPVSLEWLDDFDRHWTAARILTMIQGCDPADDGNDYLILCIELGASLGQILRTMDCSLKWVCESPYWESYLYHPSSGHTIPVFSWAVKKFSDYGVDDGLADKVSALIEFLRQRAWEKE